jgi:uncharacterized membrane-anchored protein
MMKKINPARNSLNMLLGLVGGALLAAAIVAHAQAPAAAKAESELSAAFAAARVVAQRGPAEVKMLDQATLNLPAGFVFIPSKEAAQILSAMGNRPGTDLLGMIFPTGGDKSDWFIGLSYAASGYIKDDDAKDWNADDMLDELKSGTEEANKDRASRGIPELEVLGWVERPHYDAGSHQLKWSISSKDKGAPADADRGVNYNTYALGRDGYISMNLVTDLREVEAQKPMAAQLLSALSYNEGKRYADFSSSTDKVAAFGLAALVGGVAAKKLGLLALIAAFAVKFAKVLALGGIALAATGVKFFRRKKAASKPPEGDA